jgi:hypothetical protein
MQIRLTLSGHQWWGVGMEPRQELAQCGGSRIMTDRRPNKRMLPASEIVEKSFIDPAGIPRVTLLPKGENDPAMGIPVSLDLAALFGHMPDKFQADLAEALHAQGLIKAADYFEPGASDRFRAAMLTVIQTRLSERSSFSQRGDSPCPMIFR